MLKVWLPLNGTLENKGVSDITPTVMGNGITYTAGKIGNAATFPNACSSCIHMPGLKLQILTWTCWFKCNGEGSGTSQRMLSEGRDTGSVGTNIWLSKAGTTLYWSAHKVSGSVAVTLNTWYHVALTCDGTKVHLYLNGAEQGTGTAYTSDSDYAQSNDRFVLGKMAYSYTSTGNYFPFNGQLNDVRVYDHCLSAAEVREISQGLVLHYKLDSFQGGFGNPNLGNTSATYSNQQNGVEINASGWGGDAGKVTYYHSGGYAGLPYKVYHKTATGSGGIYYKTANDIVLEADTTYTMSIWIKASREFSDSAYNFCINRGSDNRYITYGSSFAIKTEWTYYTKTFTTPSDGAGSYGEMSIIYNDAVTDYYIYFSGFKIEKGPVATAWCPPGASLTQIQDSSGYGHNGTILNTITLSSDTPRYSASTNLTAGNSMINCGRGAMVTDSITVNLWIKYSTWGNPVSCTEGGGWNFENSSGIQFPVYIASVGYKVANAGALPSANTWHMITGTYDRLGQTVNIYIDGELKTSTATGSSNNIGYHGSNVIWLGAEATGSNTTANNGMIGLISDFRIYATPLSANDIKSLYHTAAKVDNLGGLHTFEFQEKGPNKIYKTGITQGQEISEINGMSNLKYDPNVYIEPDGSAWVRIFHHVNPTSNKFASSDTFTAGVYKDENRWFNFDLCNNVSTWEFMLTQKAESTTTTETKYRWIQTKNPLIAVYADVASANIIKITTSGYTTFSHGGLYKINSNTYLCTNNGTNGNWWGAVGAWAAHAGGIPAWAGVVVKTGYVDVYLRIDNITTTMPTIAKSTKNNIWVGHNLIEK